MKIKRIAGAVIVSVLFAISVAFISCGGGGGSGGGIVSDKPPEITQVASSAFSDTDSVYPTGKLVRIDVEESSGSDIASGTIRITSASQGYDSGIQDLSFGSIYYNWDTTGLKPASDYSIEITLTDSEGQTTTDNSLTITLTSNPPDINKLVSELDISAPSRGVSVGVVRTYLLDADFTTPFGFGWTHNYLMDTEETSDGLVKVFNPDGSGSYFEPNEDGGYESPKGDFRILKKTDGTFQLKEKSGAIYYFNESGKLSSIEDRKGNTVSLNYGSNGLLENASDPSGQATTFSYNGDRRITSITDPSGRSVSYGYDSEGNLTMSS